jgi:RNA polymerase sigma-70 factor (ECF subfamily)
METPLSLLDRIRTRPDEEAWRRLHRLYEPLIRRWLHRDPTLGEEADDLTQEIMAVLVRELPQFERQRLGSFRHWLRQITLNRLREFWRSRRRRPAPLADGSAGSLLDLEDPASELSRIWDEEYNQQVMRRLMELVEPEFAAPVWQAFVRVAVHGERPAQVAEQLGVKVSAVYLAKSRILHRLRQEGRDLLD